MAEFQTSMGVQGIDRERQTWRAWNMVRGLGDAALDALYPKKCGLCGLLGDLAICEQCAETFVRLDDRLIEQDPESGVDGWARAFAYHGRAGQAVQRLKYGRVVTLAAPMSDRLWRLARELQLDGADAFLPVPVHWTRRCARGFNQAELLCGGAPGHLVYRDALTRCRSTRPLAGMETGERRRQLSGAFRAHINHSWQTVVLIDDVLTTGLTVQECGRVLKAAGVPCVYALAFAGA